MKRLDQANNQTLMMATNRSCTRIILPTSFEEIYPVRIRTRRNRGSELSRRDGNTGLHGRLEIIKRNLTSVAQMKLSTKLRRESNALMSVLRQHLPQNNRKRINIRLLVVRFMS
jgi:hypothetical protein